MRYFAAHGPVERTGAEWSSQQPSNRSGLLLEFAPSSCVPRSQLEISQVAFESQLSPLNICPAFGGLEQSSRLGADRAELSRRRRARQSGRQPKMLYCDARL